MMIKTKLVVKPAWCKQATFGVFTVGAVCISGMSLPQTGAVMSIVVHQGDQVVDDQDVAWLQAPLTPRERASANIKGRRIMEW
jgi:hypothetical protein